MAPSLNGPKGLDAHDSQGVADNASALKGDGYEFAAQYIDQNPATQDGPPAMTPAQAQADLNGGLKLVSIYETKSMAGTDYYSGQLQYTWQNYLTAQQGMIDAQEAVTSAQTLGQPGGSAIYFAMDFDPAATQGITQNEALTRVDNYFQGINAYFASNAVPYTVGVYGAGATLTSVVTQNHLAQYGWLTLSSGWADSNPNADSNKNWTLYQSASPQAPGVSVNIDEDNASSNDYGAWPVCFASGTAIRTVRGDLPVEALNVGDLAVTASGAARPIRWIGRRSFDCTAHPDPRMVRPIRIAAGAFGAGRPYRDLDLSPHHSVAITCLDEVLIPIRLLVNGSSIEQIETANAVTYWHVELDDHDILLANGLPAESFLDVGNRCDFEGEQSLTLHPTFTSDPSGAYCRPLVTGGGVLAAVRAQLAALVAEQTIAPAAPFHLLVDGTPIAPVLKGDKAAFAIPAGAQNIRLVSPIWSPRDVDPSSADDRRLGLMIQSVQIEDLFGTATVISLDDPRLAAGFHQIECGPRGHWRWTDGDARIAPHPWVSGDRPYVLRVCGEFANQTGRLSNATDVRVAA